MKLLILALLSFALQANAARPNRQPLDFVCKSESQTGKSVTVVQLTQINQSEIPENVKIPFQLEIRTVNARTGKVETKPAVVNGYLITEDVHVFFESLDKKVSLRIYLDELYETTLRIRGQKEVRMDCEEHRW